MRYAANGVLTLLLTLTAADLAAAAELASPSRDHASPRLIDDFDDGDLDAVPGLSWIVIADDLIGGASTGQLTIVSPGAGGSPSGLRLLSHLRDGAPTPFAGAWTAVRGDGLAEDLSGFQGIRFMARGNGDAFRVALRCGEGSSTTNFVKSFDAPKEWTEFSVSFSELTPQGKANLKWTPQSVWWLGFTTGPASLGDHELQVDRVELY